MLEELRHRVWSVNISLKTSGLVTQTWGNASAIERDRGLVLIKPSGVSYAEMTPADMVIVDLDGQVVEGQLKPSVDLPSHLCLYKAFEQVGGVIHTHSRYATCFAQARREIPCLGTTHADYFNGPVRLADPPAPQEVADAYEYNTGMAIVRLFDGQDPMECQAALVAGHGPFVWGPSLEKALENAEVLEELAHMATVSLSLSPDAPPLEGYLLDKHFQRKHGHKAYYGQQHP